MKKISSIFILVFLFFIPCFAIPPKCDTCARDSRGHIKRSSSAIRHFKELHPCPSTGSPKGKCPGYVIDHIKPIASGGCDCPENMQWQTKEEAKEKDKWEGKEENPVAAQPTKPQPVADSLVANQRPGQEP